MHSKNESASAVNDKDSDNEMAAQSNQQEQQPRRPQTELGQLRLKDMLRRNYGRNNTAISHYKEFLHRTNPMRASSNRGHISNF